MPKVPRFTYPRESIPSGRQAHVGGGAWLKRCRVPECDVTWENPDGAFTDWVPEHAAHEASHPGTLVPGYNVGMLP